MAVLQVGDHIRYYSMELGWRFGKVIGRHCDNIGINPSGLEMATIRFPDRRGMYGRCHPGADVAIPCFRLELVADPLYADPQPVWE